MDFRGLSAQGCLVIYQGCFGGLEGIMNCGAATAFLPNFVRFPSPRGLHSSTVQQWRAPGARTCPSAVVDRRARPCAGCASGGELSRPVSAASAASAPAARGPASAGRASARRVPPAGVTPVTPVVPARRVAGRTTGRGAAHPAGPPTADAVTAAPGAAPSPPDPADDLHDHNQHNDRQDDADDHGATLLPFPRSGPPWAVLLVFRSCVTGGCPHARRRKAELRNF
jgi:hypothetical protein